MCSATVCSVGPSLAKLDSPITETGGFRIFRTSDKSSETMMTDHDNWMTPLIRYLENPSHITDRKVQWQALKYVMLNNSL
jgi:hypothetical protein